MEPRPHESHLVVREVGAETIVYDRRSHQAHCLGPLAAAVWREWRPGEAAAQLTARLGPPVDAVAVEVALRRLARAGLVERAAGSRSSASQDFCTGGGCLPAASPARP